jgi:hypothetical protein
MNHPTVPLLSCLFCSQNPLKLGYCLTGAGSASPLPSLSSGLVLKMNPRAHGAFPWVQDFTFKFELEL